MFLIPAFLHGFGGIETPDPQFPQPIAMPMVQYLIQFDKFVNLYLHFVIFGKFLVIFAESVLSWEMVYAEMLV